MGSYSDDNRHILCFCGACIFFREIEWKQIKKHKVTLDSAKCCEKREWWDRSDIWSGTWMRGNGLCKSYEVETS